MSNCGCKVIFGYRDSSGMLVMSAGAGQPLIGTIEYCPMHASAGKLLVALKSCIRQIGALASRDDVPDGSREAVSAAEGK